jgi:hypothetical protein
LRCTSVSPSMVALLGRAVTGTQLDIAQRATGLVHEPQARSRPRSAAGPVATGSSSSLGSGWRARQRHDNLAVQALPNVRPLCRTLGRGAAVAGKPANRQLLGKRGQVFGGPFYRPEIHGRAVDRLYYKCYRVFAMLSNATMLHFHA